MSEPATAFTLEPVTPALQHEIEQFLYAEAALLDDRQWRRWFALLADDLHYWMPLRLNVGPRERAQEFSSRSQSAHFDDDKASIDMRIRRLETGMAWAEEPPSRTRHMLSNVRIRIVSASAPNGAAVAHSDPLLLQVTSNFHLYRSRLERQIDHLVGERIDTLRAVDAPWRWQIATREIHLDQATVLANNLSMFF